ncbi:MAG: DUF3343 domain-containing protein [Clostridia bacterium]|nr:DUF3343 domain-containing protein [Clostridia bacterium]
MNKIAIALSTPSAAIRARGILRKSGYTVKIIKLDGTDSGCTHGVEIDERDLMGAVARLRTYGIKYSVRQIK